MKLYRITSSKYAGDLSGVGAGLYGGRWNPVGINLLYTSGSISLASLEFLVHNLHILSSKTMALLVLEVDLGGGIEELQEAELPNDWQDKTYTPQSTQRLGRNFFQENEHYLLKVPSAIVPLEYNFLLNPLHPAHNSTKIIRKIDPFVIDERFGNSS